MTDIMIIYDTMQYIFAYNEIIIIVILSYYYVIKHSSLIIKVMAAVDACFSARLSLPRFLTRPILSRSAG